MAVKIEVGKQYLTRGGRKATVQYRVSTSFEGREDDGGGRYAFKGSIEGLWRDHCWSNDGISGAFMYWSQPTIDKEFDIVSKLVESVAVPLNDYYLAEVRSDGIVINGVEWSPLTFAKLVELEQAAKQFVAAGANLTLKVGETYRTRSGDTATVKAFIENERSHKCPAVYQYVGTIDRRYPIFQWNEAGVCAPVVNSRSGYAALNPERDIVAAEAAPVTVDGLPGGYTARVTADTVQVGCQLFPVAKLAELRAAAVQVGALAA